MPVEPPASTRARRDRTTVDDRLHARIARHADRKLAGRRAGTPELWFGLGMLGLVGWSVALPAVGGALAGAWLDRAHPGRVPWTILGLVAGLALGLANAWRWVAHERDRPLAGREDRDA